MTETGLGISPYESYLEAGTGTLATRSSDDEAEVLAENILGPKRGQDLFAMVAALVTHRRTAALKVMYSASTRLHSAIGDRAGTAKDDEFADRFGAPFRHGEPAVLHAVRALAALGLTLADDEPDEHWLQAALAWHMAARSAPAADPIPWVPGELAGDDARLRQRLEMLAQAAEPERHATYVLSAAMTLRRLARPLVEPSAAVLLAEPCLAHGMHDAVPPASRAHAKYMRKAAQVGGIVNRGTRRRPRWLHLPGNSITVLFDRGQGGMRARLSAGMEKGLPACLIPDPERMSLFAADESFQRAMARAWQQAGREKIHGMVLWAMETDEGPQRYAMGESLGAAFAVVLDEARRLQQPLADLLVVRRLVSDNAVTGRIDDLGYMQGVEGYDAKLRAFGNAGKVIIPQTDRQRAELAARSMKAKPELVSAGRWKQAASKARSGTRSVLIRDSFVLGTVAALAIAGGIIAHLNGANDYQLRLAASSRLAAQSKALDTTNPVQAAKFAAAAWEVAPTSVARASLLDVLAQPVRGTLNTGRKPVYGLAFSPNGKIVVTTSAAGTARLWGVATHQEIGRPLTFGGKNLRAPVAFSPDGRIIATAAAGGANSAIDLWEVATGRRIAALTSSSGTEADSLAFSPRGNILAAATIYGEAYLWNVATRQRIGAPLTDSSGIMSSLAFSPRGNILATASVGGKVSLWNVAAHRQIGAPLNVDGHDGWTTVAFSPNGKILATGTKGANGQDSLWDVATRRRIGARLNTDCSPNAEAFSPDGEVLAIACTDGNTRLWDVVSEQEILPPLIISQSQVWAVAYSPDGSTIATANADGTVNLWDPDAYRQVDGSLDDYSIPAGLAFSPDGKILATADSDGLARLWNVATHQLIGPPISVDTNRHLWNVAFSPDGKTLATASSDGTARLWDVATHQQIGAPLPVPHQIVFSVAFSPDGKILATGGTDDAGRLWDVATHRQIGQPMRAGGAVIHLAFNPSGRILATGNYDGADQLWNVATHRPIATLLSNSGGLFGPLAFSPHGKIIVTANQDGVVQFWNVATHRQVGEPIATGDHTIIEMAFSPNGKILATGSVDGAARLWDVATHQEIGIPLSNDESIAGIAFSPGGNVLATVSSDFAHLWGVSLPGNPLPGVCAIAEDKSLTQQQWNAVGLPAEQTCP